MYNIVGKIALIIIAMYVLIINPLVNILQEQDDAVATFVYSETVKYLEMVTNKGQVSTGGLNGFVQTINKSGNIYDIELTHYKFVKNSGDGSGLAGSSYSTHSHSEIIDNLNNQGYYNMDKDDYFEIQVVNKNKTLATKMQEFAFKFPMRTEKIFVHYGGVVKNAPY